MNQSEDALRKTWDHIDLVMKLLASAQVELMRRQFTHDRSKLQSPEWEMFADITHKLESLTYGSAEYEAQRKEMLGNALGHHYQHNRHHPEFFSNGIEGMNLFDLLEMLCDWIAATKRHADGDIQKSIEINRDRFNLSPQLVQILKNTVPWIEDEFAGLKTQKDIAYERGLKATQVRYVLDLHDNGYCWLIWDKQTDVRYPAGLDKKKAQDLIARLNENPSQMWVNKDRKHLLVLWDEQPAVVEITEAY